MKAKLILMLVKFIMGAIALGIGIWYLSSSIGGAALSYTSMDNFMAAIGVQDGNIASVNGCFMCGYISELFRVIGDAAEIFWGAVLDYIWVLLAIGFGIFLFVYTGQYIFDAAKTTATLTPSERKLEISAWFDKVWHQGLRVVITGALLGAVGMGGIEMLRLMTKIVITPVLFIGAQLSMAASGIASSATCIPDAGAAAAAGDIMGAVYGPFMCVIGNLNSVMLAGAAGGFSMMNYAWLGMGGGLFTWVAGLVLVIGFLIIGFDLFFQLLSVIFKLIFLILFMPLLIASYAFDGAWKLASGVIKNAIGMLIKASVRIVAITLKNLILFGIVAYVADMYFPGPVDGFSTIMPPMLGAAPENIDARTMSVMNVFSTCEQVSLRDGVVDKDLFTNCFTAQRATVERQYPGAFDFLNNGWEFLFMMIGLFLLYFYIINPKVDEMLGKDGGKEEFDFGQWTLDIGKKVWSIPSTIAGMIVGKKK